MLKMGRLVVFNHLTLDGVMQAPARPDEDRRGGFAHGGWAASRMDANQPGAVGEGNWEFLFGRRTYEQFASFWPHQPAENPFASWLQVITIGSGTKSAGPRCVTLTSAAVESISLLPLKVLT